MIKEKTMKNKANAKSAKPKTSFSQKVKSTKSAIKQSYRKGYHDGWNAHGSIPNTSTAHSAAKFGYGQGLSKHRKADKYADKAR